MHHPTDRIAHTTAFVTPVVEHWLEREIAQWVHKPRMMHGFRTNTLPPGGGGGRGSGTVGLRPQLITL